MKPSSLAHLRKIYGNKMEENSLVAKYTSARVGGLADALIIVRSSGELTEIVERMWEMEIPFHVIGGGSNILVSDNGYRGLLVINRSRKMEFEGIEDSPLCKAESGASMNALAQKAARLGLGGFEWAASIPGSLGGAIYGNAGAFGGEMAGNLVNVTFVLPQHGVQIWPVGKMEYEYRSSILKREHPSAIIASAVLSLKKSSMDMILQKMEKNSIQRHDTQPSGAGMGSIFKNPPGYSAGHLIEETGLKGKRIGNAEISSLHANFIVFKGKSCARDVKELLDLVQVEVKKKIGVDLELEIEMLGDW
jgi:UDP-N-acetylmuramate dehydrogenase